MECCERVQIDIVQIDLGHEGKQVACFRSDLQRTRNAPMENDNITAFFLIAKTRSSSFASSDQRSGMAYVREHVQRHPGDLSRQIFHLLFEDLLGP